MVSCSPTGSPIYVDQYTIRLTGKVIPSENRQPALSPYEARRKTNRGNQSGLTWANEFAASGLSVEEVEQNMEQAMASVKAIETKVKPVRKGVSTCQSRQTTVSHELRIKEKPKEAETEQTTSSTVTYGDLYKARQDLRTARSELIPIEAELKTLRKEQYYWNNVLKAAKSPRKKNTSGTRPEEMTTPDWTKHTVEDATEHLDISKILEEHGKVVEGAEDRIRGDGLRDMQDE